MSEHRVRNVFLPPTALKLMRQSNAQVPASLRLRTIASGGEPLGAELLDWGRRTFGVTISEFYAQTECNMVVANAGSVFRFERDRWAAPYRDTTFAWWTQTGTSSPPARLERSYSPARSRHVSLLLGQRRGDRGQIYR